MQSNWSTMDWLLLGNCELGHCKCERGLFCLYFSLGLNVWDFSENVCMSRSYSHCKRLFLCAFRLINKPKLICSSLATKRFEPFARQNTAFVASSVLRSLLAQSNRPNILNSRTSCQRANYNTNALCRQHRLITSD